MRKIILVLIIALIVLSGCSTDKSVDLIGKPVKLIDIKISDIQDIYCEKDNHVNVILPFNTKVCGIDFHCPRSINCFAKINGKKTDIGSFVPPYSNNEYLFREGISGSETFYLENNKDNEIEICCTGGPKYPEIEDSSDSFICSKTTISEETLSSCKQSFPILRPDIIIGYPQSQGVCEDNKSIIEIPLMLGSRTGGVSNADYPTMKARSVSCSVFFNGEKQGENRFFESRSDSPGSFSVGSGESLGYPEFEVIFPRKILAEYTVKVCCLGGLTEETIEDNGACDEKSFNFKTAHNCQ